MAPSPKNAVCELIIRDRGGKSITFPLHGNRVGLGRSAANELCYPDDHGLSRQHLVLLCENGSWLVEDLGSKNGTLLNGKKLQKAAPFRPGDRISAGHLIIEFSEPGVFGRPEPVTFVESDPFATTSTTMVARLDNVLSAQQEPLGATQLMQGTPQMRALIKAGRELAGHRPLEELFPLIMDLAMEAVMAGRGVLMTLDGDELNVRAARGDGFKISSTVRDRVLKNKESLLVRDAQLDTALQGQMSIVQQRVRGIIAVPLQTNDRVIGLLYLDSPMIVHEFTREDLNLLTVMANVAAIRIEHARLNEVEEAERQMARDMQQAAQIQARLLPSAPPVAAGLDIAGKTVACRTVGGDYYDFLKFPDGRVGMLVGDVAGKGMPASLLMSSLQARVQVLFEDGGDLANKIARLNKTTCQNCPENRFITFFMAVADPATGELAYVNAGHNPPLLVHDSGNFTALEGGGMILGIMPKAAYEERRAKVLPGDVLVLFSDGVTEAADPHGQEFGEQRLAALVRALRERPSAEIVDHVLQAVASFSEGAPAADDITVVVARRV
ncbi:MAG TPA: SpoIIE family protein phosphatase [Bryobacteraceae bacterium]|nr:SpoIIE family protein phosphatase [Bryobacteraceae bacterium]